MIQNHHSHGIINKNNDSSTLPPPSTTYHHPPPCTISSSSTSSSSLLPTMVVLVSPKLVDPSINSNRLSMTVHYLPDPYSSGSSSNQHWNTSSTSSASTSASSSLQLRPYFLQHRERPNSDPSTPKEVYYQICEMTMIDHITNNNSNSHITTMNENNNYHSFLIANENHNNDLSTSSSSSSYIVQDGSIYVLTPIDPLFWLLRDSYLPISTTSTTTTSTTTTSSSMMDVELPPQPKPQWQPLLQFLQEYDPIIQQCIYGKQPQQLQQQYQHLLNVMSMGTTDDNNDDEDDTMILVQFSVEKALLWLHQKQTMVEQHLLLSSSSSSFSQNNRHRNSSNSKNTGAFASGFTVAKENNTTVSATNMKPTNVANELQNDQEQKETLLQQEQEQQFRLQMKEESIQLVCNYLSLAWQDHFLQYLKVHDPDFASILQIKKDQQQEQEFKSTNKRSKSDVLIMDTTTTTTAPPITDTKIIPTVDWNMSLTTTGTTTTDTSSTVVAATSSSLSKPKKLLQPITAGAKRLLKVNQRGIQSVSSFFSVGAKNKTKNPTKK